MTIAFLPVVSGLFVGGLLDRLSEGFLFAAGTTSCLLAAR
jgi:hypothetical protein